MNNTIHRLIVWTFTWKSRLFVFKAFFFTKVKSSRLTLLLRKKSFDWSFVINYKLNRFSFYEYVQSGLFSFMIFYQSGKRNGILQKFCIFITVVKQYKSWDHLKSFHSTSIKAYDSRTRFQMLTQSLTNQIAALKFLLVSWLISRKKCKLSKFRKTIVRWYYKRNLKGLSFSSF